MQRSALWWKAVLHGIARTARPCRKKTVELMIQAAWRQSLLANTERADHQRALYRRRPQDESLKSHRASDSQPASKRAKILQLVSHLPSHTHLRMCWKWQVRNRYLSSYCRSICLVDTSNYTYTWSKRWDIQLRPPFTSVNAHTHLHHCCIASQHQRCFTLSWW